MRNKIFLFWLSLYIISAIVFWLKIMPLILAPDPTIPDYNGWQVFVLLAVLSMVVGFVLLYNPLRMRWNPNNESISVFTLCLVSIITPFWFIPLGVVFACIKAGKAVTRFAETMDWGKTV